MRDIDKVIQAMFVIANKQAVTVDFHLNKVQRRYSAECTSRDIILKARREGFSSYIRAEWLVACLVDRNTRAVILSHDAEATSKHLEVVKFHIRHMKGAKPEIGYNSKIEITFPKTDSTYYIGTAGSKSFGRGDTITHLHMSEAAFYPDLKALQASVMQAAAHAKRVVLESTANGFNYFYDLCEKARRGEGEFKLHFYPWFEDEENRRPLQPGEKLALWDDDIKLQRQFNLTNEQMKWYITKRREFMVSDSDIEGLGLFKQEYPSTIEEAFISTGATFFQTIPYESLRPEQEGKLLIYKPPMEGHRYVVGVDYCGGVGQDYAVIQVIDASEFEQVAVYRDNWADPEMTSVKAANIAKRYNLAHIVPEVNNHGILGVDILKRLYPTGRIYKRESPDSRKQSNKASKKPALGFITTERTKPYSCSTLKTYLKRGLKIHDSETYHELQMFTEIDGALTAPEREHDDLVMALALAAVGIKELVKNEPQEQKEAPSIDWSKPVMPFSNVDELMEIAKNTPRGRDLISAFYSKSEASRILSEMRR